MKIILEPKEEAAMIAYIALEGHCKKRDCWKTIGKIIEKYGKKTKRVVYRGHTKEAKRIKNITPFFSTTPKKIMAKFYAGFGGNLFKLHLCNVKTLSTSNINYKFSKDVIEEIRKFIGKNTKISKGGGTYSKPIMYYYTLDEYLPRLKKNLHWLVFNRDKNYGEEILVLNGGKFYKNKYLTKRGYKSTITKKGYTLREAWYKI